MTKDSSDGEKDGEGGKRAEGSEEDREEEAKGTVQLETAEDKETVDTINTAHIF